MPYERLPTTEILPLRTADEGAAKGRARHPVDASKMPRPTCRTARGSREPGSAGPPRGVSEGTRTPDRLDHNQELYQLSYAHQDGTEG